MSLVESVTLITTWATFLGGGVGALFSGAGDMFAGLASLVSAS